MKINVILKPYLKLSTEQLQILHSFENNYMEAGKYEYILKFLKYQWYLNRLNHFLIYR